MLGSGSESGSGGGWNLKAALGFEEEQKSALEELTESCSLTYEQRLIGFSICFITGWVFSFLSSLFIVRPVKFALVYTLGSLCSIGSTAFLFGPIRQIKSMCAASRRIATLLYFLCMGLTLWAALKVESVPLVIVFLVLQLLAMIWYSLSYIPGGQTVFTKFCSGLCGFSS